MSEQGNYLRQEEISMSNTKFDPSQLTLDDFDPPIVYFPQPGSIPDPDVQQSMHIEGEASPTITASIVSHLSELEFMSQFFISRTSRRVGSCCKIVHYEVLNGEGIPSFTLSREAHTINFWTSHVEHIFRLSNSEKVLAETTIIAFPGSEQFSQVKVEDNIVGFVHLGAKSFFYAAKTALFMAEIMFEPSFHSCTRELTGYEIFYPPKDLIGQVKYNWSAPSPLDSCFGFNFPKELDVITKAILVMTCGIIYDKNMHKTFFGATRYWTMHVLLPVVMILNFFTLLMGIGVSLTRIM